MARTGGIRKDFIRAAVLLLLLPSIALSLFVLFQTRSYIEQQVVMFMEDGLRYAQDDFERLVQSVVFTRNQVVFQVVSSGIREHLEDRSRSGINLVRTTSQAIYMTYLNSPYVAGIRVFIGTGYKIETGIFSVVSSSDTASSERAFDISKNDYVTQASDGSFRYVLHLGNQTERHAQPVTVELRLPFSEISRITEAAAFRPSVRSMLITSDRKVLVAVERESGASVRPASESALLNGLDLSGDRARARSGGFLILAHRVRGLPLFFVSAVPDSVTNAELIRVSLLELVASLIVFFLSIGGAIIVAGRITRPLYSVIAVMDKIGGGDFSHRISAAQRGANEDIQHLTNDFNVMVDRINALVENLKRQEKEATLSRVLALQAQINPHFLYNTLDLIRGLASWRKIDKVKETAAALAELFRYSIDRSEEPVRLRDEIRSLSNYLKIQQLRFESRFDASLSVGPETEECFVPRLILQPIVENAFRHGLEPMVGPGRVQISAVLCRSGAGVALRIAVADTGVGIDEDRLRAVSRALETAESHDGNPSYGSGVGLQNVHRRIRLSYGEPYGVSLVSDKGKGTTVTVLLPART
ncbi:MAG: sensor histidine kinase [Spirochaetia bacterium]